MKLKNAPKQHLVSMQIKSFEKGMNGEKEENILPTTYAKKLVNFDFHKGVLCSGIGVKTVEIGTAENSINLNQKLALLSSPSKMYHFRRLNENGNRADYLIFYDSGSLIAVDLEDPTNENIVVWSGLSEEPTAICYNLNSTDVILFCFESGGMIVWDGETEAYLVADAPSIKSMALHYERLFATSTKKEQNTVWFSDDLDPTNWSLSLDEAGYIQMQDERGASNVVVNFLDYVYVFREYGIARISGYGDQTQFLVSQLSCQTGKIFPQTVTLVGDRILFLAEDGAYSFNGLDVTKIMDNINPFFEGANNQLATAVAGEGKWFLFCNIMMENEFGVAQETQVLLTYDTTSKKVLLSYGLGIVSICSLRLGGGSKVLAIIDKSKTQAIVGGTKAAIGSGYMVGEIAKCGKIFSYPLFGVWQTGWTDIGFSSAQKVIRKVSLTTNCKELKMVVETDRCSHEFDIGGQTKQTDSHILALRGSKVRFTLCGDASDVYASDLKILIAVENT